MTSPSISLFGRFHVDNSGAQVTSHLEARKVQELFAYMLLYRRRCSISFGETTPARRPRLVHLREGTTARHAAGDAEQADDVLRDH